jgi:hypothetical protein
MSSAGQNVFNCCLVHSGSNLIQLIDLIDSGCSIQSHTLFSVLSLLILRVPQRFLRNQLSRAKPFAELIPILSKTSVLNR